MKAIVIGAGVVGAATAYFLGRSGAEVTVLDRNEQAGDGTSAGLAGLLSPSDANAWASPEALKVAAKSLFQKNSGIQYKLRLDPSLIRWSLAFAGQCHPRAVVRNTTHKYRLADYSMAMLRLVEDETGIDFDATDNGILFLCRDQETLKESTGFYQLLTSLGLEIEAVDLDRATDLVPALEKRKRPLVGGLYSRNCRTGNAAKFAQNLLDWCVRHQRCKVEFGTEVKKIHARGGAVSEIETSAGPMQADIYILAAGPYSGLLGTSVGLHLPICPVKGFSITARIVDPSLAPKCGVADESSPVASSVMGSNLRISSSAVFDGFDLRKTEDDFHQILRFAEEMLPGVADYAGAPRWSGLRPMTPSSVPLIGRSRHSNLFVNTGHGHLGWTLACGSSQLISDIVNARPTDIDATAYQPKL